MFIGTCSVSTELDVAQCSVSSIQGGGVWVPSAGRGKLEVKEMSFPTAELAKEVRSPKIDAGHGVMCHHWQEAAANARKPTLRRFLTAAIIDEKPLANNACGHLQFVAVCCHFKG